MDTAMLREFAFKKLQEARDRGTELAVETAARAASSISSSVPVPSSFVFHAQSAQEQPVSLDKKLETLQMSNNSLRKALMETSNGSLDESLSKLDLVNESMAFTIENIQEATHVMKLLNRQLKDSAAMRNPANKIFYKRER